MRSDHSTGTGKSIAIVGGGVAGLCAGCYAQMNGYRSRIYEAHTRPGGLMTSWDRKGYTIDYCIHWLVGSSPRISLNRLWQEVGMLRDREIVNLDVWEEYESPDGRRVTFYRDLDRLEAHLCEVAPLDAGLIKRLLKDARRLASADPMAEAPPRELMGPLDLLRLGPTFVPWLGPTVRWGKVSIGELADRFETEVLSEAIRHLLPPQFSAMILLNTLGWLHAGDAGYPIGGSLPLARNLERRYLELGGEIQYRAPVAKILTERTGGRDRATGLELADGREERAEIVVSAADGHATLYDLLGGRYLDETLLDFYEGQRLPLFYPILYVGVGVDRDFNDEPQRISGLHFLSEELIGAGGVRTRLIEARIMNFDPTMAPQGKSVILTLLQADGEYWCRLRQEDREAYTEEKARIGEAVVRALDARFPGLKDKVEMVNVATPATTVRYTGNWKASFEGWMPTRGYLTKGPPQRLPGLDDFYMVGQWVAPGGGLPSGVITARAALQFICARDGVRFRTTTA